MNYTHEDLPEMGPEDYKAAKATIDELLEKIGVTSEEDILEIISKAKHLDWGETEVNGKKLLDVDDDHKTISILYGKRMLNYDEVEWFRIEYYKKLMYIYFPVDASGKVDVQSISFDIYPNDETDDNWENVQYRDCLKYNESKRIRRRH